MKGGYVMSFYELIENYNSQDKQMESINERIVAKSDDDSGCCCMKCFDCLGAFAECMS